VTNIQQICSSDAFFFYNHYWVNKYSPAAAVSIVVLAKGSIWETIGSAAAVNIGSTSAGCYDLASGAAAGTKANPGILWIANCANVWFRNVAGAALTLTSYSSITMGNAVDVAVDPGSSSGNPAYVVSNYQKVWKTNDNGVTWTEITGWCLTYGVVVAVVLVDITVLSIILTGLSPSNTRKPGFCKFCFQLLELP